MEFEDTLSVVQRVLHSFNPNKVTPSTHLEEQLASAEFRKLPFSSADRTFVEDTFYGVLRYRKMLAIVVDGLFARHAATTLREDYHFYMVWVYLAVWKLQALTGPVFCELALSQPQQKIHLLFSFMFDEDLMAGWLREQWLLVYDVNYVDNTLLEGLRSHLPTIKALLDSLEPSAGTAGTATNRTIKSTKPPTVPEPFNITKPAPRLIPKPPVQIVAQYKSKPVPEYPTSLADLERQAVERRKKAKQQTLKKHAKAKPPQLHSGPSKRFQKLKAELDAKEKKVTTKYKAKPMPEYPDPPTVKLNAAAILREDALFRAKQEREAAIIKAFESELKDSVDFEEWKAKMEAEDEERKKEMIRERKRRMMESKQAAADAMARVVEENTKNVQAAREQARVEKEAREAEAVAERQAKAEKAAELQASIAKALETARAEVVTQKKQKAAVVYDTSRKVAAARAKAEEEELKQKRALIRRIKAMEETANARAKRPKEFDPTSSSGLGLMEEMCLVELHERLSLLKIAEREAKEQRRQAILQEKREKQEALLAKAQNLRRVRTIAASEAAARRRAVKETRRKAIRQAAKRELQIEEEMLEVMERKREEKAERALQLAEDIKKRRQHVQFLHADADAVQVQKFKSLRQTSANRTRRRQEERLKAATVNDQVHKRAERQRQLNAQRIKAKKVKEALAYAKRVESMKKEVRAVEHEMAAQRKKQASTIRRDLKRSAKLRHDKEPKLLSMQK